MAKAPRRTGRKTARAAAATTAGAASADPRERVVDAFMALVAEHGLDKVELADIAGRAGITLAELRGLYPGRLAILADFSRRIDRAVLAGGVAAGSDEEARDRLFDVMMRRFDALAPYKEAIRRVARAARCDPALASALHGIALGAQKWNLAAAGVHKAGALRLVAAEGMVLVYAETMRTWLDDDDPDLGRTMAALDRALRRGEQAMRVIAAACSLVPRFAGRLRRAGA
jgi:AcrR family transcriptional regulator